MFESGQYRAGCALLSLLASAACLWWCVQQFREQHEWIPPEITLSKIRNLKRRVLELWVRYDSLNRPPLLLWWYFAHTRADPCLLQA